MKSAESLKEKGKVVIFFKQHTFCRFDLTNVSPDGVLFTDSGGMFSLRASSEVTLKNS